MPMGGWTKELLAREGHPYLDEWLLSDDPAKVAEATVDDNLFKGYITRCTSLKEEAENQWTKPDGYPYLQCEGAAMVGKRRCEYCRLQAPMYHAYSVFPYLYGENDTKGPTPGLHNNELAKAGVKERAKAIKAGLAAKQLAKEEAAKAKKPEEPEDGEQLKQIKAS
jgi:hypothetical protein